MSTMVRLQEGSTAFRLEFSGVLVICCGFFLLFFFAMIYDDDPVSGGVFVFLYSSAFQNLICICITWDVVEMVILIQ